MLNEFQHICQSYTEGIQSLERFSEKEWFGTTQVIWMDQTKQKAIQLAYDSNQVITGFYLKLQGIYS